MGGAVNGAIQERLRTRFGARVRFDEPLVAHTSFRIGGPADALVEVQTPEEIREIQCLAAASDLPILVLGSGTNVLVSDRGLRGVVVKLGRAFAEVEWTTRSGVCRARAGAALSVKRFVGEAARRGLSGIEFAEGIPGSIGGGLLMNAGAFGGDMADVVDRITGVDAQAGVRDLPRSELHFGYRFLCLPDGFLVTHVEFVLPVGDPASVRLRLAEMRRCRASRQPLGFPNAGSVFRNPPGHFAGRLIESVGMKGRRVGGAMVSERHANFIVNIGAATAADVRRLMDEVARAVWQAKAVRLVPEVKLVGEWEKEAS